MDIVYGLKIIRGDKFMLYTIKTYFKEKTVHTVNNFVMNTNSTACLKRHIFLTLLLRTVHYHYRYYGLKTEIYLEQK